MMSEMISVKAAAERWNITERRVSMLCKDGKITGAMKHGNRWMIPADQDGRLPKNGECAEASSAHRRVQLLLGFVGILLHRQDDDDQGFH